MFNRRYIFKWWIPHCYVSLQDCIFYDYSMYQRTVLQSACITCITCCHIMSVQLPCSKIDAGRDPSLRPSESVAVADKLFMGTADLKSKKSLQMLSISRPTWTFEDVRLYVKFYLTQRGSPSRKKLSSSCNRNSCFIFFRFRVLHCQQPCFLATHPCPLIRAEIRTHGCHKKLRGFKHHAGNHALLWQPASHLLLSITYPRPVRLRLRSDRSAHHTRMVFLWPSTSMREPSKSSTARLAPS